MEKILKCSFFYNCLSQIHNSKIYWDNGFILTTKCQADLLPSIQGHSFGLPHTYLNIFFSEITGLFDGLFIRLFRSLDQNVYGKTKYVPL